MISNLTRFEKDLDRLIEFGRFLANSIRREADQDEFDAWAYQIYGDKDAVKFLSSLPDFSSEYESWYSEALVLIKRLLPDRLNNSVSLYEKPKGRKDLSFENYVIQDFIIGLRTTHGSTVVADKRAAVPRFDQQLSILNAAKTRFKSSLFEIQQLVQADLFDSEIDTSRELLKNKFYRAAGAVAGVVLEKHLQQVCDDHNIIVKKKSWN